MAAKLLVKRFGIKDVSKLMKIRSFYLDFLKKVPSWMKQFDEDNDGRLSYKEFKLVMKINSLIFYTQLLQAILPPAEEENKEETDE